MRNLVGVTMRIGTMPDDPRKAARFLGQDGTTVLGNTKADVLHMTGKGPPPADNRWFYLVEANGDVVGYVAAAVGASSRIPSCHVAAVAVPRAADPVTGEELLRLMFRKAAAWFFAAADRRGYVTADVPAVARVVRDAAEWAGYEAVHACGTGRSAVVRYVKFPESQPDED